jgi:hypothetical protein
MNNANTQARRGGHDLPRDGKGKGKEISPCHF